MPHSHKLIQSFGKYALHHVSSGQAHTILRRLWQILAILAFFLVQIFWMGEVRRISGEEISRVNLPGEAWRRHVIDDRYDGPDGTKLGDVNGDGRLDVVTGWESEGLTVAYLQPESQFIRRSWPSVVVGKTPKAEDAVFLDLNRDGNLDVISSCEQHVEKAFVHWGPVRDKILDPHAWRQQELTPISGISQWMFAEPIPLRDGDREVTAVVLGGKNYERNQTAKLGLVVPGDDLGAVQDYRWQPLADVSWVMSIIVADLNGDKHADILYSDKHGPGCGVWWLENPGSVKPSESWSKHAVTTGVLDGCMLIAYADFDGDGLRDVVAPVDFPVVEGQTRQRYLRLLRRLPSTEVAWQQQDLMLPPLTGQPKAVTVGDINLDGKADLVVSSTGAENGQTGTYWLEQGNTVSAHDWQPRRIAAPTGIKYDLVHVVDLDGDGDLDTLTSEEKVEGRGLGVFWYENPVRARAVQEAPQ
ncbi:MAG: VCBS repeat-containing protein [Pirellulales bacterium]|nr:VCBS repeat-containing protein [Pirellulales bacterium]